MWRYKKRNTSRDTGNTDTKDKAQETHQEMTQTPVPFLILKLSGATVGAMLAGTTYNLVDMYFVAQLGNSAVAAVGVLYSVLALLQAVGYTFGMGAGSRISRYLGDEKQEEANACARVAILLAIGSGILLMTVGFVWQKPLIRFLGATDTALDYALSYSTFTLLTAPILCVSYVLNNTLRAEGMPVFSLVGIGAGALANAILDPIFIYGLGLGMHGAGLATFCGQSISLGLMCFAMHSKKSVVRIFPAGKTKGIVSLSQMTANVKSSGMDVIRTGLPSFFRQGLVCVAAVLLNRAAETYGDDAMATISVSNKIFAIVFAAMVGYGQGFAPVAGYNYGAKKYKRVRASVLFATWSMGGAAVILGVVMYGFAPWILSLFGENEKAVLGIVSLRIHAVSLPFLSLCLVTGMMFQALGKIRRAILISSVRQGIFFLPLIFVLPIFWGASGVAVTQGIADILAGIFSLPFFLMFYRDFSFAD